MPAPRMVMHMMTTPITPVTTMRMVTTTIMRMTMTMIITTTMITAITIITKTNIAVTSTITGIPMLMTTNEQPEAGDRGADVGHAALYRLLTWLSPAFPVGGFSYSSGIEWAVEAGDITAAASLRDWLASMLADEPGFCDGVFLAQ